MQPELIEPRLPWWCRVPVLGRAILRFEFWRRRPWVTRLQIAGRWYGGGLMMDADPRPDEFLQSFPQAERVLDLGSLEGIQAFRLAQGSAVKSVVGIEGRDANLAKANFLRDLFGMHKVRFVKEDLEMIDLQRYGPFDAVFCAGVLYHLVEPWRLITQIARVTPNLYLFTHYAPEERVTGSRGGYRGWEYREYGLQDPLSGLSPYSFWLTLEELQRMLDECGFGQVTILQDRLDTPYGPVVHLIATAHPNASGPPEPSVAAVKEHRG